MLANRQTPECDQKPKLCAAEETCNCSPAMIKNIARQLQSERLRLLIPPGHVCRVQCQWVVVRGIAIINDTMYVLDSLKIFDDQWVLGIPYEIARAIYQLRPRNIGIGKGEDCMLGRSVESDLCRQILFMLMSDYIAIQRQYDLSFAKIQDHSTI